MIFVLFSIFAFIYSWGVETCKLDPLKGSDFCDPSIPVEKRIEDILKQIHLDEKIQMLDNTDPGVGRLNINKYEWWQEALHGLAYSPGANFSGKAKVATSFPQVCNLGRTFDEDLWRRVGSAISTEARALANLNQGYLSFWTPNINIFRDPRWGRGHETPGEDPYVSSRYAANFINSMQVGPDYRYLKTLPCCKHYTAYDLEDWHGIDRYHFDAQVSAQDMEETFQPPFKACVVDGHVAQVMCSYNAENGVPSCANELYMETVMRDEWGFDGHVVSDCGAIEAVFSSHKYKETPEETCQTTLRAGCDLDCGKFYGKHLTSAVEKKIVTEADIDLALGRLFQNRIRLGEYDPWETQEYRNIPFTAINSKEHQDLALEAARKSMVLLKNSHDVLPLDATTLKSLAIIGPNAKADKTLQGNYYGPAPYIVTVYEGIENYAKKNSIDLSYSKGCNINDADKSKFDEAKGIASQADATVLVMGIDSSVEAEAHDRTEISFPGVQSELIELVTQNAKGPVILVMISGGGVDISFSREKNDAILWGGYPSQSGGQAVAEVLFGDYNPAGRMTITVYPERYIDLCPFTDMTMRPNEKCPGRSYKFYNATPVYAFGDGESYTTFSYDWKSERDFMYSPADFESKDQHFEVKVTNTGKVDGDCVVLAYITNTFNPDAPMKELFGFSRIHLKVGESADVYFGMGRDVLEYVNKDGERVLEKGKYQISINDATTKTLHLV